LLQEGHIRYLGGMLTDKQCYVEYKLTDDHFATIYEAYQTDIYLSLEDFRREVAEWRTHWVITKRNDLPTTL
jgi:hypothetical protein